MVLVFLFFGVFAGFVAGGLVLWTGGSVWFGLLAYSLFGSFSAVVIVCFLALIRRNTPTDKGMPTLVTQSA